MSTATARPTGLLDAIVAGTRTLVATRRAQVPLEALASRAEARAPRRRAFREALAQPGRVNIIAECKRRSPARGVLAPQYDPAARARAYEAGGAAAVSVLTEPTFFDGALEHLSSVREAVDLPVLRKDFIVEEYQLFEARAAGADAALLIVAALQARELQHLMAMADHLGLAALVEVHSEHELDIAAACGADIIGVNSRNLRTLAVDLGICAAIGARLPAGAVAVAESGVRTHDDIERLRACGYAAFLIGERLMTAPDATAALAALRGVPPDGRSGARG